MSECTTSLVQVFISIDIKMHQFSNIGCVLACMITENCVIPHLLLLWTCNVVSTEYDFDIFL